jgi:hypothetical protein
LHAIHPSSSERRQRPMSLACVGTHGGVPYPASHGRGHMPGAVAAQAVRCTSHQNQRYSSELAYNGNATSWRLPGRAESSWGAMLSARFVGLALVDLSPP